MPSDRSTLQLHPLPLDLQAYGDRLPRTADGANSAGAAARTLARALATSPAARRLEGGAFVVREGPTAALGVLSRMDASDRAWLAAAIRALQGTIERLRWVQWPEVEAAAEELAEALRRRLGRERLADAAVRGVPRGGAVAMGLLAYALELTREAFDRDPGPDRLTLLVDDCALTGARFRERLARLPEGEVAFATLFSPPELRAAIEGEERRVVACVGGRDLPDHAARRLGSEYGEWVRRWRRRSGRRVYWIGQPDHLVFPWSEPQESIWDDERGRESPAFSVAPPELCLARRAPATGGPDVGVQVQPRGRGPLRPAPHLLWGRLEGVVVIRDPDRARALTLEGTAATMWRELVREGTPGAAARRVARAYDAPVDRIRADLEAFARQLLDRGALVDSQGAERAQEPGRPPSAAAADT